MKGGLNMIGWIHARESVLDMKGVGVKNRRTTPVDVLHMLEDFAEYGTFAEVIGWEERYNCSHSCYTSLVKQCAKHNYPIEVLYNGGRVYLRNTN